MVLAEPAEPAELAEPIDGPLDAVEALDISHFHQPVDQPTPGKAYQPLSRHFPSNVFP